MTALDRIEELAKQATRWAVVVTRNNHRSFSNEEVEAEVVQAMVATIRAAEALRSQFMLRPLLDGDVPAMEAFDAALSKLEQMK